jgi:hypothetical protein
MEDKTPILIVLLLLAQYTRRKEDYSDQAAYLSLNKILIAPLRNWKSITEREEATHHSISLTEDGKHALKFLGTDI